jgi:hypothetical protein
VLVLIKKYAAADLVGARPGGKFVVSRVREAYDEGARGPNRKFRIRGMC